MYGLRTKLKYLPKHVEVSDKKDYYGILCNLYIFYTLQNHYYTTSPRSRAYMFLLARLFVIKEKKIFTSLKQLSFTNRSSTMF
jgi:hypothetical protein